MDSKTQQTLDIGPMMVQYWASIEDFWSAAFGQPPVFFLDMTFACEQDISSGPSWREILRCRLSRALPQNHSLLREYLQRFSIIFHQLAPPPYSLRHR